MKNVTAELQENDLTQEYYDFRSYLITYDMLVIGDLLLYLMLISVLINVIFSWLPEVFGTLQDLISKFFNWQVCLLFAISVCLMILFSFLRMALTGQLLYNMSSVFHGLIRNLIFFCGGFFLESNITFFGI